MWRERNFFEVIPTKYFSIFWIPVAPTESKNPLLECPNCHERFYIQQADYLSAIKDVWKSKPKYSEAIQLPQDSIDFCIVPCDICGQKLKVPKNDKLLRVTCLSCKNTFNFQEGEKILESTSISSYNKPNIAWWKKKLYLLVGVVIACVLAIPIILFSLPENKQKLPPPIVSASPQIVEKPLKKYF
jgi:hypothetical protein